ncbi:MAG: hypothetical protein Q7S96_04385 [bacterium]|nr:hypothetical protein [bacterium]
MSKAKEYLGRIVTVRQEEGFGFIGLDSVSMDDGSDHDLETTGDIFVHQDDCGSPLQVGVTLQFEVVADHRRGDGFLRARCATELAEVEVMPDNDPVVMALATQRDAYRGEHALAMPIPPHPMRHRMKQVPEETVAQVVQNDPLPETSRDETDAMDPNDPRTAQALRAFMEHAYPHLAGLEIGYDVLNADEEAFDTKVAEATAGLRELGMEEQAQHVESEMGRFRGVRRVLGFMAEQRLLRPNTCIPTRYLPDLFMACPVWFHATDEQAGGAANAEWDSADPRVHAATIALCDIFPKNERWSDTVQLFNRRLRTLARYKGDVIPLQITRLIREARQHFDHLVIATPYHDVAGREWQDPNWLRGIDPYVIGMQNGCSHFFILGRFSDSGVFPLLHELVGDTIEFLRKNREKLAGFNETNDPYWHVGSTGVHCHSQRSWHGRTRVKLGTFLQSHVDALLRAFDAGKLFDWLRGEWSEDATSASPTTSSAPPRT